LRQPGHRAGAAQARIDLDRELALRLRAEGEARAQRVHQRRHLVEVEVVRRAAAHVQLQHLAVAVEQRRLQRDLALQPHQVGADLGAAAGDDPVAAAVEARAGAERQVHVQRQRARDRLLVAGRGTGAVVGLAERGVEVRRGRVGRVARPVEIVPGDQLGVEGRGGGGDHGAQAAPLRGVAP